MIKKIKDTAIAVFKLFKGTKKTDEEQDEISTETFQISQQIKENNAQKKLLILDIDETLISARAHKTPGYHKVLKFNYNGQQITLYITKRPYLSQFLENMSQIYDICVFTAGVDIYCKKILDIIDQKGKFIKWDYSRNDCTRVNENIYYKDIFKIQADKYSHKHRILVDNSLQSFILCPQNGILIKDFYGNSADTELLQLQRQLNKLAQLDDVQQVLQPLNEDIEQFQNSSSI